MNVDYLIKKKLAKFDFWDEFQQTAKELETEVYLVGGYIRDILLGREEERDEMDFMVTGDGTEYAKRLAKKLNVKNVNVFKTFGTAHFRYNGMNFEFVGARRESYTRNSRNPEVLPGSFEEDIRRRDFTINAIALSLCERNFGEIIDIFNGIEDIKRKIIRTPLDPIETFSDDPLRIMRAIRFATVLEFDIEERTLKGIKETRERLEIITQERITEEFLKIMSAKKPSIGLQLMLDTGVMEIVFPEVAKLAGVEQRKDFHHKDVFLHTLQVVDNVAKVSDNLWLRVAALLHDIAKPRTKRFIEGVGWTFHGHEEIGARMIKGIFKRMKFPLSHQSYVEKLVRLHLRPIALVDDTVTDSAIRRLIVAAGEDLDDLITLCRADITSQNPKKVERYLKNYDLVMRKVVEVKEKDKLRAFQSPVRGDEIMEICNLKPSRKVGEIKKAIEEAILDGKIPNTYEAAKDYLMKIKDEFCAE
jgi:putative nucleotidyltransferase with HDIG domain